VRAFVYPQSPAPKEAKAEVLEAKSDISSAKSETSMANLSDIPDPSLLTSGSDARKQMRPTTVRLLPLRHCSSNVLLVPWVLVSLPLAWRTLQLCRGK
jgi:hypothetical protein